MITKENIKEKLDFKALGAPYLELRSAMFNLDGSASYILLEEPPMLRTIHIGKSYQVWTPWLYHYFDITHIESDFHWQLSSDFGYQIFGRGTQFTKAKRKLHESWLFNLSYDGMVCYPAPGTRELKGLTPAEKILKSINAWWMGKSNLDYDLAASKPFWVYIGKQLLKHDKKFGTGELSSSWSYKEWRWNQGHHEAIKDPEMQRKFLKANDHNLVSQVEYEIGLAMKMWSSLPLSKVLDLQKKHRVQLNFSLGHLKYHPARSDGNKAWAKALT